MAKWVPVQPNSLARWFISSIKEATSPHTASARMLAASLAEGRRRQYIRSFTEMTSPGFRLAVEPSAERSNWEVLLTVII